MGAEKIILEEILGAEIDFDHLKFKMPISLLNGDYKRLKVR